VHRSAIVNVDRVREIHPLFRGDCALVLADGTRLKLSRSRRKDFEALFAQPRHAR
jgi:two-component system LytT family response regulator